MRPFLLAVGLFVVAGCGEEGSQGLDGGDPVADPGTGVATIELRSERVRTGPLTNSSGLAFATFVAGASAAPSCGRKTFGDCVLSTCPIPVPSSGGRDMAAPHIPNAGSIDIAGTRPAITLSVLANGGYQAFSVPDLIFNGGESLTISAPGDVVPNFSLPLTAPTTLVVTAPAPAGSVLMAPRDKDLVFRFTGTSAAPMIVILSVDTADKRLSLRCSFAGAGGSGTVPVAALATLPDTAISVEALVRSEATTAAGKWTVTTSAVTAALDGGNHAFRYGLQLQ